jgi:glycine/D-amino acid oxidase-like deaminating enzyme
MSFQRRTIIIGGGFYGCCLAIFFRNSGDDVVVVEAENQLLTRASYNNQARVHQGYHYPRSILTGQGCVASFPLFAKVFPSAVVSDFTKLYAIARVNSFVTAAQFSGFCRRVGAPLEEAPPAQAKMFDPDLIEAVFQVREYAFDAVQLREIMQSVLKAIEVPIQYNTLAVNIEPAGTRGQLQVRLDNGQMLAADQVFNCAFANINSLLHRSGLPILDFRHELAEIALVRPPSQIAGLGITVMDGPFFSTMPFPSEKLYSLSHVRYTPHKAWRACDQQHEQLKFAQHSRPPTQVTQMLKDSARYLPVIQRSEYVRSLFEVKTTLDSSERNDGRPILCKRNHGLPGLHVIMGGKIDNVFDILQSLSDLRATTTGNNEPMDAAYFRSLYHAERSRVR